MKKIYDADMGKYTSFRCGSNAAIFEIVENTDELRSALEQAHGDYVLIGNGSNILFAADYGGTVIKLGRGFAGTDVKKNTITAGAAVSLAELSRTAAEHGLSGLEFACGIPGTVGGAVFMNAGAYGGEIADSLQSVIVLTEDGQIVSRDIAQISMSYRDTDFMKNNEIILSAVFCLNQADVQSIKAAMDDCMQKRNAKQPVGIPSAGSFFKRPENGYAARLIEDAGLKGFSVGGARVSELHAGFIVNDNNASPMDIIALKDHIQKTVSEKFGIELVPEVRIIGIDKL